MFKRFVHVGEGVNVDAVILELLAEVQQAVAAVHRRPVNLRRAEVTGSESALRGARVAARMWGLGEERVIDVYSLLAPNVVQSTLRTFQRAPLQVLARLDVLAGGSGVPDHPSRLSTLAEVIASGKAHPGLLPGIVHGELVARAPFGQRSGAVGWASTRLACMLDWDAKGLCVPEPYWFRKKDQYLAALAEYQQNPRPLLEMQLRGWLAGAAEAEGIARAAS